MIQQTTTTLLKVVSTTFFCFVLHIGFAQNEPQYTQYMFNIGSFNPAYVGTVPKTEATLLYRTQWVGIDGAPNTQNFTLNFPFSNKKMGLGLHVLRDAIGPATQTFFNASYAYIIQTSDDVRISFGIDAGGSMLDIDLTKGEFENDNDNAANLVPQNTFYPTVGAGIFMYANNWYLGLSAPNFLSTETFDEEVATVVDDNIQVNAIAGYVFDLSSSLKFKPAVMAHFLKASPVSFNLSANFLYAEKFMLGASYRVENAFSGVAGFQVSDGVFIGYAYDYTTTALNQFSSGSHEIILKIGFGAATSNTPSSKGDRGKPKQIQTPRFF